MGHDRTPCAVCTPQEVMKAPHSVSKRCMEIGVHVMLCCVDGEWLRAMMCSVCCAESSLCVCQPSTPAGCSSMGGKPVCKKAGPFMADLVRPAASISFPGMSGHDLLTLYPNADWTYMQIGDVP